MRIQLLNGGLGNQVFQYLFVRFAERYCPGETWYFDDSEFFISNYHNGYEIEKVFGIKANLLSNYFDQDVWEEIIRLRKEGRSLPQTFMDMGLPISLVAETGDYAFNGKVRKVPVNGFYPEIVQIPEKNLYYHGYWINKHWFAHYREENLAELTFPDLTDLNNIRIAELIRTELSVGVHIRRGDFITVGWAMPPEYYKTATQKFLETWPDAHFFVFTDDPDWCRENSSDLGLDLPSQTTFVTGNMKGRNYIDLQLLSMCQGMILSKSSFCYLAALMDRNLKLYMNPTPREI